MVESIDWALREARFAALMRRAKVEYVPPREVYALRQSRKLSLKAAGALLDKSSTWWHSHEVGHEGMTPEDFSRAKAAIAKLPRKILQPAIKLTLADRLQQLEGEIAKLSESRKHLEDRIAKLEAQLRQLRPPLV